MITHPAAKKRYTTWISKTYSPGVGAKVKSGGEPMDFHISPKLDSITARIKFHLKNAGIGSRWTQRRGGRRKPTFSFPFRELFQEISKMDPPNGPRSAWQSNRSDRTLTCVSCSRWWPLEYFHIFYFSPLKNLGKMNPFWRIFFRWVGSTTNQFFNIGHVTYTAQRAGFLSKDGWVFLLKAFLCTVFARIQMFVVPKFVFFQFWDRSDNLIQPKMMHCKNFLTEIPHPTFKTCLFVFCKQVMEKRNKSPQRMGS